MIANPDEYNKNPRTLQSSEQRFRAIFEQTAVGMMYSTPDGHFLQVNQKLCDIIGFSRAELLMRTLNDIIFPADMEAGQADVRQVLAGERPASVREMRFIRADGSLIWTRVTTSLVPDQEEQYLLSVIEEIEERKKIEEFTRQLLLPIGQMLSYEGMVITKFRMASDIIDEIIMIGFDKSIEQMILDRVRGKSFTSRIESPEPVEQLRAGNIVTLDVSQPPYHQRQPRSGLHTAIMVPMLLENELVGCLTLYPQSKHVMYTEEERTFVLAMAKLVALLIEREHLQQASEDAWIRVERARETIREMDTSLDMVNHELKTPLTILQATIQLARRQLTRLPRPDDHKQIQVHTRLSSLLDNAEHQIKGQTRLINDLQDISRIHANRLELTPRLMNLTQLILDAIEDQRTLAPDRLPYVELPSAEVLVFADPQRVRQVINNYLSNALKYSEAGHPIVVHLIQDGTMARLEVTDQGPGLSTEQQEQIWHRFYRVPGIEVKSSSEGGLGLGLYISRIIIEQQAGHVGVESRPGSGSTFWFTLPIADPSQSDTQ